MRYLLPLALLLLSMGCTDPTEPTLVRERWERVRSVQGGYFHGLWFLDKENGWAVGDSGRIIQTQDGGDSWRAQLSGTQVQLKCVRFVTPSKGWIGGSSNSLGRSTDGGASWIWQHLPGESRRLFMTLSFSDENTGWVGDNFGGIFHTTDGGKTWESQVSGTNWAITSIKFLDASEGWATATNRVVLHTTNAGNTWSSTLLDYINYGRQVTVVFEDICFSSRTRGWIATNAAMSDTDYHPTPLVSTSDRGANWKRQITQEKDYITAISFIGDSLGWAAGANGILHTEDGGIQWSYQLEAPALLFVGLCFVDEFTGWALTFTGEVYRYR